ncbi:MAG: MerR family transcriptional regulator [Acidimicrobiales bacterium]
MPEPTGARPVYSIGAAARMLGVDASSLRAWEERYSIVVPARSSGGQRLYSRDDLERIRFVLAAMAQGSSAADAHRLLAESIPSVRQSPSESGPTVLILLAERDPYAAHLVEYFLRTEGYDVALAGDQLDAARLAQQRKPALCVVELMIQGGGLALCRQLSASGDAPVLALSVLDLSDAALAAGASGFLRKPIDPLELVSTVRDLLGQSALTRRSRPVGV